MIYAIGSIFICLLIAAGIVGLPFLMEWLERDMRR